jgi:pilus assembly protein CpaF
MGVVLTSEERLQLNQDLLFRGQGPGPAGAAAEGRAVNDILVNGPQRIFVERPASWN